MNTESLSKQHGGTASFTFVDHSNPSIKDFSMSLRTYVYNYKNVYSVLTLWKLKK